MLASPRQPSLFDAEDLPENLTSWEVADRADQLLAEVVFNRPLSTVFHYVVPEGLRELIVPGQRVEAPFGRGNERITGFCVGLSTSSPTGKPLKSLLSLRDRDPLVDGTLLKLTKWISEHYLCGWGQVLQGVIPAGVKSQAGTREVLYFSLADGVRERLGDLKLSPKQKAIVNALINSAEPLPVDQLTAAADCGLAPIHALRDKGLLVPERRRQFAVPFDAGVAEAHTELRLTDEQQAAVSSILGAMRAQRHETLYLHGVTGSGKTEVYIRAIEEVVSYGRQAIVLVPEISLTPQTIRRFRSRFPAVAVLHSHLTDAERHVQWRQIASGQVSVVVGARSAVFAPTPHLGLIVIDEEHESTFKQETTPRYHARDVARKRAELLQVPLLLGSATPTLESWLRLKQRQDLILPLPRRVARRPMPPVHIIDIREDPFIQQQKALGRALLTAMRQTLKDGGQIILFLNIRGFAPLVLCRACGKSLRCPDCEITLTWHQQRAVAICHLCGHQQEIPPQCPNCRQSGFRYFGIGTERLEQELKSLFPEVSLLRMDSDTMQGRGSHETALDKFRHGEVQILLGTQMIAKGLDFPNVTLVGVVDADTSLRMPDLRSRERTFQLIAQVAGRTGRGPRGGRVLVQTSCPEDPAITFAAKHDYVGFATQELEERKLCRAPPYESAVRVILRSQQEKVVEAESQRLVDLLRIYIKQAGVAVRVAGPAPCPLARLQGYFRFHIQLMSPDLELIRRVWQEVEPQFAGAREMDYVVDVEPLNFR